MMITYKEVLKIKKHEVKMVSFTLRYSWERYYGAYVSFKNNKKIDFGLNPVYKNEKEAFRVLGLLIKQIKKIPTEKISDGNFKLVFPKSDKKLLHPKVAQFA